jgi:hypothetical protein
LEEIELVANRLNEAGADAFRTGDFDATRRAIEEAERLADFREKVKALQREWAGLPTGELKVRKPRTPRTAQGRLGRELRTPEEAFRRPILETLIEL